MTTITESITTGRGIAARLCAVARDCEYVQKDGNNNFHKYRYASAAAILARVNRALCAHGVAVVGTTPKILSEQGVGRERVVTVQMEVTVADVESGERATFVGLGSGQDAGDKAVMKACTAALKYVWMGALSISTGDDPEADEEADKQATRGQRRTAPREAPRAEPDRAQQVPEPHPAESEALVAFRARLAEIELPGEGVAVWMRRRGTLSELGVPEKEAAWKALCARVEDVGKMKNAKVWLKKAIAEEDARRTVAGGGGDGPFDRASDGAVPSDWTASPEGFAARARGLADGTAVLSDAAAHHALVGYAPHLTRRLVELGTPEDDARAQVARAQREARERGPDGDGPRGGGGRRSTGAERAASADGATGVPLLPAANAKASAAPWEAVTTASGVTIEDEAAARAHLAGLNRYALQNSYQRHRHHPAWCALVAHYYARAIGAMDEGVARKALEDATRGAVRATRTTTEHAAAPRAAGMR